MGTGPIAINAEFLEFEAQFDALKVKQIVFVQYEGEWIVASPNKKRRAFRLAV